MYLDTIKKLSPQESLDYLMYAPHKQAQLYYKAIHSAINNATQTLKVSPSMLQFKLFTIEEGHAIRRFRAGARGMVRPIKRRFAHIKIILIEKKAGKQKVIKEAVPEKGEIKAETKKIAKKEVTKSVKGGEKKSTK
jgi:large subunit ribosomal protein L22